MDSGSCFIFRKPRRKDVEALHALIVESTGGKTEITTTELSNDLFQVERTDGPEVRCDNEIIDFNIKNLPSNRPIAQAILAEANSNLVGYLIFHFHYSPWMGHCVFIDDIYTLPSFRKKGITKHFLDVVTKQCKEQNIKYLLFNGGDLEQSLMKKISESKWFWYRNNGTDWSVYRMII